MVDARAQLEPATDQLDFGRVVVGVLAGGMVLCSLISGFVLYWASQSGRQIDCRVLIAEQGLTSLSVFDSGTLSRAPELSHPGVDLRHSPAISTVQLGGHALIIESAPWANDGARAARRESSERGWGR